MKRVNVLFYIGWRHTSSYGLINSTRMGQQRSSSSSREKDYFLAKIGLSREDINWPVKEDFRDTKVDYVITNPYDIQNMYGASNLSAMPIFKGGYINFGYWKDSMDPDESGIDEELREKASEGLYSEIAEMAKINGKSRVVDVGCGTGVGIRYLLKRYSPERLIGMDQSIDQIERAKQQCKEELSKSELNFITGDAMSLPFPDDSFTHILSVEAAQHFPSVEKFIQESNRALSPGGKLVFTSFFATNSEGIAAVKALIPDHDIHCSSKQVAEVTTSLTEVMRNIQVKSIGKNVWYGLEKWLLKIGFSSQWTMLWPALYKAGYIDYFIFSGDKHQLTNSLFLNPTPESTLRDRIRDKQSDSALILRTPY
jgi:MPBQ/MSBQ methyltransferase